MRAMVLGIIATGLLFGTTTSAQEHRVCTDEDAIRADKSLDSLNDWRRVYESFKRYRQCDDGSIAEGYSDTIASLLVNRWNSVEQLFHLWRAHPGFGRFVLAHVDESLSPEQTKTIAKNARDRCPPDSKEYCKSLEKKAQEP